MAGATELRDELRTRLAAECGLKGGLTSVLGFGLTKAARLKSFGALDFLAYREGPGEARYPDYRSD